MTRPSPTPAMVGSLMDLFRAMEQKARRMAKASAYEPRAEPRKPGPKRNATDEQILSAYATGLTIHQVAQKLRTGKSTVSAVLHLNKAARKQGTYRRP